MSHRKYVIDTSVFLTDHLSIIKFGSHDIIIPLKVLEEIDELIEAVEKELDLIAQYDDQLEMMNKYFSDEDDTKLLKE